MSEYAKLGLFTAKVETTFGTDAAPTSLANTIGIKRAMVPVEPDGTPIVREILDATMSSIAGLTTMKEMMFKVVLELRGNRTDGTTADISSGSISNVLDIDPLLRACDLAATYVAEGSVSRTGYVTYAPTIPSDAGVSLTIYGYSKLKVYKAVGCKGSIDNIKFIAGNICEVEMTFRGQFLSVSDASLPSDAVFLSTVPPIWAVAQQYSAAAGSIIYPPGTSGMSVTAGAGPHMTDLIKLGGTPPAEYTAGTWYRISAFAGTTTFRLAATLGGSSITHSGAGSGVTFTTAGGFWLDGWTGAIVSSTNLKLGQQLVAREDGNSSSGLRGHIIAGWQSGGDFTMESVAEATHPVWGDWDVGTVKKLRINLGAVRGTLTGTGNRIAIEASVRLGTPKYQDTSGKRMMNVPFTLASSTPGQNAINDFKLMFM